MSFEVRNPFLAVVAIFSLGLGSLASTTSHTIRSGDTLSEIALEFGVTVDALVRANDLADANHIVAGSVLEIPAPPSPARASNDSALAATSLPPLLVGHDDRQAQEPVIETWAEAYEVDADLLKGLTYVESGWQADVVSHAGAVGIGQLMPATVEFVSTWLIRAELDPLDAEDNIRMSARYLAFLLDRADYDEELALAAYYQGYRSVTERGMYAETVNYVAVVSRWRDWFAAR